MDLSSIYRPIEKELKEMEEVVAEALRNSKNQSIVKLSNFLLESPGKRIRPALVILSAKASSSSQLSALSSQLIKVAAAVELIHMASLIHDDVIDRSDLRHHKPTVNSQWGTDVSIALGDYLYSVAFELISDCGYPDITRCISSATKTMCEGELVQVCERDNLDLLKERYIIIVKKKTAALFSASCQAGSLISHKRKSLRQALSEYGLNFGIAFQIIDDYLDLVGEEQKLGKMPGQDIGVGEVTLPLLNLFGSVKKKEKEKLKILLASKENKQSLRRIKTRLINSGAKDRTKETAISYISLAKEKINPLTPSLCKNSLLNLADFIIERGFNGLW